MSAPPLPDAFGNYALGDFVEVVSPAGVDWWPQTPGWWLVGIILFALIGRRAWRGLRHWYRNRYRREAISRLSTLNRDGVRDGELIRELNTLLKLTAMSAHSRERVASLTGQAWPEYLNAECESPTFDDGAAHLLASGSYTDAPVAPEQRAALVASASDWIRQHRDHRA